MGGWRHASCFAVGSQETRDWDRNWDRMEIPCVFCPQVKYTSNQQPHVGLQHASTITPPSHLRHCACAGPVASLLASPSGSDSGCVVAFISPGGAAWARTGRASSSCGRGRGAGRETGSGRTGGRASASGGGRRLKRICGRGTTEGSLTEEDGDGKTAEEGRRSLMTGSAVWIYESIGESIGDRLWFGCSGVKQDSFDECS